MQLSVASLPLTVLLLFACQSTFGSPLEPTSALFRCVEPDFEHYEKFISQYNRTFENESEKLERMSMYINSLKRLIMFNRIVQEASLNNSNLLKHPEIGDYHFIEPRLTPSQPLWYADINDCELGLLKSKLFNIMYLIEQDNLAEAYRIALDNSKQLPLLSASGFEQLTNILLVRLHDRFVDGKRISRLYRWPLYVKRLAAYAYHRRQASQPDFSQRLALVSYAYPTFFKDVKYNLAASNRTNDNWAAHREHERFNKLLGRKFSNLNERNKRLVVFRQRWSLLNLLNEPETGRNDWRKVTLRPDWMQLASNSFLELNLMSDASGAQSQRLVLSPDASFEGGSRSSRLTDTSARYRYTQFSDLTDLEFVAYLTDDQSILTQESVKYLDTNFGIRVLDDQFKSELAAELELRRALLSSQTLDNNGRRLNESLALARKVIEELISDVGLPIGRASANGISEAESMKMFEKVAKSYGKSYLSAAGRLLSDSAMAEERLHRYEEFKFNYARFKAWATKEGWLSLDESETIAALRLADMSWHELKLSLFKLCCLAGDNLATLSSLNASISYLSSNEFLCQPLTEAEQFELELANDRQPSLARNRVDPELREQRALELYFTYCLHFNKHHSDVDTFYSRFNVFRYNIDHIKRHSCSRTMTLFPSLLQRLPSNTLSQIDSLDPQRSYTDDLNLDRFRYFVIPNLEATRGPNEQPALYPEVVGVEPLPKVTKAEKLRLEATGETETITKRRHSFFSKILRPIERESQPISQQTDPERRLSERLSIQNQGARLDADRYRLNNVAKIYGMVMQHYRLCGDTIANYELKTRTCHSSGQLSEQASLLPSNQLTGRQSLELRQRDPCALYWLGLESWSDGLSGQDPRSVEAIKVARCPQLS